MSGFKVTAQFLVKLKALHEPTVHDPGAFLETEKGTRNAFLRVVQ